MHTSILRRFDTVLLLAALALGVFGLAAIYSAVLPEQLGWSFHSPVVQQGMYLAIGLALCIAVASIDYRYYKSLYWPLYALNIGLLVAVRILGHSQYGANRWINLGFIELQPSEPAKLLVILTLAKLLADHEEDMRSPRTLAMSMLHVAPLILLVYLQPDLGTAIVIGVIWLGMVLVAGARPLYMSILAALAAASAPLMLHFLHSYQRERLLIFLNPESDPLGQGYNILQARISVGSGGLLGRGFTQGPETQLLYLRVSHTDYVFAAVAEQFGFVGELALFAGYVLLLMRGVRSAVRAGDTYGRLLASGIVIMLLVQTFVNIGSNIGIMPVAGIPLPFVSYGGSSLLTILVAIGVIESICLHGKREMF